MGIKVCPNSLILPETCQLTRHRVRPDIVCDVEAIRIPFQFGRVCRRVSSGGVGNTNHGHPAVLDVLLHTPFPTIHLVANSN